MKNKDEIIEQAQGAEIDKKVLKTLENFKQEEAPNVEETKTERMPSPAQTIKTLGQTIKRLEKLKLLSEADYGLMKKLHEKVVKQYMGFELGL